MNSPYNTRKTDPLLLLAEAIGAGGLSGSEEELTALGFKLGDKVKGDPLFRSAELPDGWKREGSDHAMWSHIVDDLGRKRISIFYKAAFYDRDAFLSVMTVYAYVGDCLGEKREPIADETWATSKALYAAAVGQIAQCAKYLAMYDGRDDEYGRERAAELREEIAAAQALIDSLSAGKSEETPR